MERSLKNILQEAKTSGDLYLRDWKNFPLPVLPREKVRLQSNKLNLSELEGFGSGFSSEMNQGEESATNEGGDKRKLLNSLIQRSPANPKVLLTKRSFKAMQSAAGESADDLKGKKSAKNMKLMHRLQKEMNFLDDAKEEEKRNLRKGRFASDFEKPDRRDLREGLEYPRTNPGVGNEEVDFQKLTKKWRIVGTSTSLEKQYLRLTSEPHASSVRPLEILKQSLKMLVNKWKEGKAEYRYIIEQFRSIRQDLVIQHIRNKFTVKVYETNARICLECHDLEQFNQCQSRLYDLYRDNLKGNKYEFLSYRLLYMILNNLKFEMNRLLLMLQHEEIDHPDLKYVIDFREALDQGNVARCFNLYKNSPNMSSYLIDIFVVKLRVWGLQILTKAYCDKVDLKFLTSILAFHDENTCRDFIIETKGLLSEDGNYLMCKDSHRVYLHDASMKKKFDQSKLGLLRCLTVIHPIFGVVCLERLDS
eukprot:TRINITY_DN4477_c0_g1_i17.p1 TRINITY_DN4477_c0_g1~~TRINITY_DN4477_c0_g1_i17.p1  ORF type:complete len:476 (+),score=48.28 TRINITY_DN4477_c0_g1_i17:1029-2456(+)